MTIPSIDPRRLWVPNGVGDLDFGTGPSGALRRGGATRTPNQSVRQGEALRMTTRTKHVPTVHPAARMYADEYRAGKLSRREFLTRATALGITTATAYTMIGATQPAKAAGHM